MAYIDKQLLKAAKTAGNKINLTVGDTFVGNYTGYETKKNDKYNSMKYHFKFIDASGTEKALVTGAGKVIGKFATIPPKSKVSVTRLGEGSETDYDIEVIGKAKQAPQVEDEEIDTVNLDEEEEDGDEGEEPNF